MEGIFEPFPSTGGEIGGILLDFPASAGKRGRFSGISGWAKEAFAFLTVVVLRGKAIKK